MQLTWMGTASLLLESDGTILAFDPFPGIPLDAAVFRDGPFPNEERYRTASAVLVTHGHVDHILYIPSLYGDSNTPIYCTAAPRSTLAQAGMSSERLMLIAPGWEGDLGSVHIRALQGRHCRFDVPLVMRTIFQNRLWTNLPHMIRLLLAARRCREAGETLFYELSDDTVRVQIMGSINLDPETEYPGDADVLILPFQGRSDIDEYALGIVERLAPKAVLLDHYDDAFPPLSAEIPTERFCGLVQKRLGIPCRALTILETIQLSKAVTE